MYRSRLPRLSVELHLVVDEAVKTGAEMIAQGARDRVPVRSGKLRDAIHTEDGDGGTYVIAGNGNVFYGHIVEHGGAHNPPRPFLVPALEEDRSSVIALAAAALRSL
jgi:HK97 gp10 family phage protein